MTNVWYFCGCIVYVRVAIHVGLYRWSVGYVCVVSRGGMCVWSTGVGLMCGQQGWGMYVWSAGVGYVCMVSRGGVQEADVASPPSMHLNLTIINNI